MDNDPLLEGEFTAEDASIHLNHAGVSPWPRRAVIAVTRFADENLSGSAPAYERWLRTEQELRLQMCRLINAGAPEDIALLKNTSEGLSVVAHGLTWRRGDNIVTTDQEFPSNRIVWQSLEPQGVELRRAAPTREKSAEDALFELVDSRTRLIAVSSVQYSTGLRMDLVRIGEFCRRHDILFCIDAIQSLGALEFDLDTVRADFVAADGHKWMLGPEGVALLYVRPALRERLALRQFGWRMVEDAGDYEREDWVPARSARRFECGSPNLLGIHGLQASLSLLFEIGLETVSGKVLNNSAYMIDFIEDNPGILELISDRDPARRSGIVTFLHRSLPTPQLYRGLRERGVVCAMRGGGIRFSPHFYTRREALANAMRMALEAG
ncbi:MAG: aminotransferase class V-fold PLP-dependent enzyme [Gammaproteobacteria bacterium]|nr:aminotransferase class V-fold PLP-dependent enzyme [Gammaproteobacteria bacterium]